MPLYRPLPNISPINLPALLHSGLAILVLSLPAPLSLLLLRLLGPRLLRPVLGFLGALAVGTLCGDALLHLLPHVCETPCSPPDPVVTDLRAVGPLFHHSHILTPHPWDA